MAYTWKNDSDDETTDEEHFDPILGAKQFTYYFLRSLEDKLVLYLDILEETQNVKATTSSLPGKAGAGAAGAIPFVGKGASIAVQEADKLILTKLDKKKAKGFADFAYEYRDKRDEVRSRIVDAAISIFISFEMQFMEVTTEGGRSRAMQKLGYDASHRLVTYILENEFKGEVTKNIIIKGVLKGSSIGKIMNIFKSGRTLANKDKREWKSSKFFTKPGLCLKVDKQKTYYKNEQTTPEKYGHRLVFSFEDREMIKDLWQKEDCNYNYDYVLDKLKLSDFKSEVMTYIFEQYPIDKIKQEIAECTAKILKHTENFKQTSSHHKEVLENTLVALKKLHADADIARKEDQKEIKAEFIEIKNKIDIELYKKIDELKKEIDGEGKIVLKINKKAFKEHPDVQNVDNALKKIGNVFECGEAKKIEREAKRISDDLAAAESKVRNVFRKIKF